MESRTESIDAKKKFPRWNMPSCLISKWIFRGWYARSQGRLGLRTCLFPEDLPKHYPPNLHKSYIQDNFGLNEVSSRDTVLIGVFIWESQFYLKLLKICLQLGDYHWSGNICIYSHIHSVLCINIIYRTHTVNSLLTGHRIHDRGTGQTR